MPMYEYACRKCGHSFEKLVKSAGSKEPIACPECQSTQADRKFSVFAVSGDGAKSAPAHVPTRGGGGCGAGCGCHRH